MSPANILQRRVKPRKYDSEDDEASSTQQEPELTKTHFDDSLSSSESSEERESQQQHQTHRAGSSHKIPDSDTDSDTDTSPETLEDVNSISFGALARAQESLGNLKRKRGDSALTSVLSKKLRLYSTGSGSEPESHHEQRDDGGRKQDKSSDLSRSSKHAPAQQSSKKPVSRRRDVIATLKLQRRDPRFEPLGDAAGSRVNEERIKKNYAFLDSYRESEMAELRAAIRTTKDELTQADLKRALLVMESRKKTRNAKELRQKMVREHRAREKELVKQGKKPFYLKKAELQRRALVERFEKLGEKQVDKVIERRRKKIAAAERKQIPKARRVSR